MSETNEIELIKVKNINNSLKNEKDLNLHANDNHIYMKSDNIDERVEQDSILDEEHYYYRGDLFQLVPDVFEELENNPEVVVEKKIEILEVLTGCETENRYNVYLIDNKQNKKFLMKFKEISNCWCRNCVPAGYRSFVMNGIHIKNSNKNKDYKEIIVAFRRPYRCTACCIYRPKMYQIYEKDENDTNNTNTNNNRIYAEIRDNCACGLHYSIIGEDGSIKYKIVGDYLQCGYALRYFSFGKCYDVNFWIYNGDADTSKDLPVGNIHKVYKGMTEVISDSNAYVITFPLSATGSERIRIISSIIQIDLCYYEINALFGCASLI